MNKALGRDNKKNDLYLSLLILLIFSTLYFIANFYISKTNTSQRYEIYILKTKGEDLNQIVKTFNDLRPKITYSLLSPERTDGWARLISFSIISNETINVVEIYNEIAKREKCHIQKMEADFSEFNVEEWGRMNGSAKECKVFFIYERKL